MESLDKEDGAYNVLVLGGTSFMGLTLVENLLETYKNTTVYHLNRGNEYWGNKIKHLHDKFKTRLVHLKQNRKDREGFIKCISKVSEQIQHSSQDADPVIFHLVADFSCYIPSDMKTSLLALKPAKLGIYVYISTDSVYEVTQAKYVEKDLDTDQSYETNDSVHSFQSYSSSSSSDSIGYTIQKRNSEDLTSNPDYFDQEGRIREGYAFHNKRSNRFRDYLCKMDAYGFEKLTAENILRKMSGDLNLNYAILRLPDVIGPYDDSARFWVIVHKILALQQSHSNKSMLKTLRFEFDEEEQTKPMSLVSSTEVVKILKVLLENHSQECKDVFNLTSQGEVTLKQMHEEIFNVLDNGELQFDDLWVESDRSKNTYPSVHCGAISNQKVVEVIGKYGYSPENVKKSIQDAAIFFSKLCKLDFREDVIFVECPYISEIENLVDKLPRTQRKLFKFDI